MVREFLNNYFGFNRQQRNGLVVLMCISLLLLIVRLTYPTFMSPGDVEVMNLPVINNDSTLLASNEPMDDLFYFDPNTASKEELMKLGLKEKTAMTLIKYRKKNVLRSGDDLGKVFGITSTLLGRLKPFVRINPSQKPEEIKRDNVHRSAAPAQVTSVELNGADSLQLTGLPGIGPAFAHRILKYRALLGGFVRKEQLREVYGFKQETYDKVSAYVTVNSSIAQKINLNQADFKTVNRHPYISYEVTKALFNKKRQQPLNEEIVKEIVSNDSLYQRLRPYLEF